MYIQSDNIVKKFKISIKVFNYKKSNMLYFIIYFII